MYERKGRCATPSLAVPYFDVALLEAPPLVPVDTPDDAPEPEVVLPDVWPPLPPPDAEPLGWTEPAPLAVPLPPIAPLPLPLPEA